MRAADASQPPAEEPVLIPGVTAGAWLRRVMFLSFTGALGPIALHFAREMGDWSSTTHTAGMVWTVVSGLAALGAVVYGLRLARREVQSGYTTIFQYQVNRPELFYMHRSTKAIIRRPTNAKTP